MEILVVLWLLLSVGVGYLASERGRSGVGWALLSILTSPLLGLIIVLLTRDLKVEASNREREEMRHREQLAALAGSKTGQGTLVPGDGPRGLRPAAPAESSPQPRAPFMIADELEKLASLLDRGHLTSEEFSEQKSLLIGRNTSPTPKSAVAQTPASNQRLVAELSSSEKCKAFLVARGCLVAQPTEDVWEVMQPSGITAYARSSEALQALAMRFATESPLPVAV
jgi:Short C-terminal domain